MELIWSGTEDVRPQKYKTEATGSSQKMTEWIMIWKSLGKIGATAVKIDQETRAEAGMGAKIEMGVGFTVIRSTHASGAVITAKCSNKVRSTKGAALMNGWISADWPR
jgi:hypothetical protein